MSAKRAIWVSGHSVASNDYWEGPRPGGVSRRIGRNNNVHFRLSSHSENTFDERNPYIFGVSIPTPVLVPREDGAGGERVKCKIVGFKLRTRKWVSSPERTIFHKTIVHKIDVFDGSDLIKSTVVNWDGDVELDGDQFRWIPVDSGPLKFGLSIQIFVVFDHSRGIPDHELYGELIVSSIGADFE